MRDHSWTKRGLFLKAILKAVDFLKYFRGHPKTIFLDF